MIWIPKNIFGDETPIASLFDKFFLPIPDSEYCRLPQKHEQEYKGT